jgi:hypothetical protein
MIDSMLDGQLTLAPEQHKLRHMCSLKGTHPQVTTKLSHPVLMFCRQVQYRHLWTF